MTVVVDASVVVSALVDGGIDGRWSEDVLGRGGLVAPHLLPVEVTNTLRRLQLAGTISGPVAAAATDDLDDLPVDLVPFAPFRDRVWELRATVAAYDAWYVAVAETLGSPLATRDVRLTAAPGPTCAFVTPAG